MGPALLVALYRSKKDNQQRGRRHQTPAELVQLQLRLLLRWLPGRAFLFAGDSGYGSHELARFAQRQQGRLALVSRFNADANLYGQPPPYAGKGRTPDEQPLRRRHVRLLREYFARVEVRGFQLLSMARRVLRPGRIVSGLEWCDERLLHLAPSLARLCRYVVLTLRR